MKFHQMPPDIQEKVMELVAQFPFTADEVLPYYLMGGDHADQLLKLKLAGASDQIIVIANQEIYDKENKKLWQELKNYCPQQ